MGSPATGTRALVGIGLEQQIPGSQVGAPLAFVRPYDAPDAPTSEIGAAGAVTGSVEYAVSFIIRGRGETGLSAWSAPIVLASERGTVTPPTWTDPLIDGLRLYRRETGQDARLLVTRWASGGTYSDNIAIGAEPKNSNGRYTVPRSGDGQTAANAGLLFLDVLSGTDLDREDTNIRSEAMAGGSVVPRHIPGAVKYDDTLAFEARAGHVVIPHAAFFGLPETYERIADEPTCRAVWSEASDLTARSVSFWGSSYKGGDPRPIFRIGNKVSEMEYAMTENKVIAFRAKVTGTGDSDMGYGAPDGGNTGSYPYAPFIKGARGDANRYVDALTVEVIDAPTGGSLTVKVKIGGGAFGGTSSKVTIYYDANGRQKQAGSQASAWAFVLGPDGYTLGHDVEENRLPLLIYFPGDVRDLDAGDAFVFAAQAAIPGPGSAPYSGAFRRYVNLSRFTPTHVTVKRGAGSAETLLAFEAAAAKLARKLNPVNLFGPEARTPVEVDLEDYLMLTLEPSRRYDSKEFQRLMKDNGRLFVEILLEGPRIQINPGVLSTYRESIRYTFNQVAVAGAGKVPVSGPNVLREKLTLVAEAPDDRELAPFETEIISAQSYDFTTIQAA